MHVPYRLQIISTGRKTAKMKTSEMKVRNYNKKKDSVSFSYLSQNMVQDRICMWIVCMINTTINTTYLLHSDLHEWIRGEAELFSAHYIDVNAEDEKVVRYLQRQNTTYLIDGYHYISTP